MKECASCRRGEVYDVPAVGLFYVRDPETKRMVFRGYLCEEHVTIFLDDGYEVVEVRR